MTPSWSTRTEQAPEQGDVCYDVARSHEYGRDADKIHLFMSTEHRIRSEAIWRSRQQSGGYNGFWRGEQKAKPIEDVYFYDTSKNQYQRVVSGLIYLVQCSRYDIAYSVQQRLHA